MTDHPEATLRAMTAAEIALRDRHGQNALETHEGVAIGMRVRWAAQVLFCEVSGCNNDRAFVATRHQTRQVCRSHALKWAQANGLVWPERGTAA